MDIWRRHWYTFGLVLAVAIGVYLAIDWNSLEVLQRVLLLNFIVLLVHQFEEYGWPGGEPAIMNKVLRPSNEPNRYPLNQNSALVVNVLLAYPFYLVPVFLPHIIWLGLAPTLFALGQFIVHGIQTNVKLRSFYNPGLFAVVFGHIPLGVYYIWYISAHGLATGWDWLFGVVYTVTFMYLALVKVTYDWLASPNSKYRFAEVEMRRFDVDGHLARLSRSQGN